MRILLATWMIISGIHLMNVEVSFCATITDGTEFTKLELKQMVKDAEYRIIEFDKVSSFNGVLKFLLNSGQIIESATVANGKIKSGYSEESESTVWIMSEGDILVRAKIEIRIKKTGSDDKSRIRVRISNQYRSDTMDEEESDGTEKKIKWVKYSLDYSNQSEIENYITVCNEWFDAFVDYLTEDFE